MADITRYPGVHGSANVAAICTALEACGARIISAPRPDVAPFEFRVMAPDGEVLDLVCYAFTANRYKQGGRPSDEHRFQVKYGSEFDDYHDLFIDPQRRKITLMFGWHAERRLFIAVDPVVHTPTWFSMSVEFKARELSRAAKSGWHGWERERTAARRKREMPMVAYTTETVLAFTPKNFLRYARFERVASGLDPGERLLLMDRMEARAGKPPTIQSAGQHPLEAQLGLSAHEILDVLGGSFRLLVAVRGSVAEHHLERRLRETDGISDVARIDEDGQPDFEVTFDRRRFRLECKNVLRKQTRLGPRVDFQKTRAAKDNPCSRYYAATQFEVLAACLHPVTEKWDFLFVPTGVLPPHKSCPGKISATVNVSGPEWNASLPLVLERCLGSRG